MNKEFQTYKVNQEGIDAFGIIVSLFDNLLTEIDRLFIREPNDAPTRELSIVKTKLEEAGFFAKKGISVLPYYQD